MGEGLRTNILQNSTKQLQGPIHMHDVLNHFNSIVNSDQAWYILTKYSHTKSYTSSES